MPGLFFYHNHDVNLEKIHKISTFTSSIESKSYKFKEFLISQIYKSPFGHSYYIDQNGIHVWIYGAVFGNYPKVEFAEIICGLYRKLGEKFIHGLNGEYNIIIYDETKAEVLIANDRFGIRPWYVYEKTGVFVLSPDANILLDQLGLTPQLNKEIAFGFLAFNKMRLGNETLFEDINVLPPAQIIKIDLKIKQITKKQYWQLTYNETNSETSVSESFIDELVDCYTKAMNTRSFPWKGIRSGISLSGGLDSRTMVAALNDENLSKMSSHTFGLLDSAEVQLADEVAKTAGIKSYLYPLGAPDYVNHAHEILNVTSELDIFVQAAQQKVLKQEQEKIDVLMTGIDLDVTLGGIYLEPEIMAAKNLDEIFSLIKQKNKVYSEEDLNKTLTDNFIKENAENTFAYAYQLLNDLPQTNPAASYDLFVNQYSMRRIIMLRYAQIRSILETSSPMYDYDFIDLVRSIPLNQRAKHASFIPFLMKLSPDLSKIVYQRTMLPADAPLKYWRESELIESQREKLYLRIWRETKGRSFIPYRRYYTNFDEWIRMDQAWIKFTDDLLQNSEARIYENHIVKPNAVQNMIHEHQEGVRSHRQRLIILMSLELFLQKHF